MPTDNEQFASKAIREGHAVDFNVRCQSLGSGAADADCRTLPGAFFRQLFGLKQSEITALGVQVVGARITGAFDLSDLKLNSSFSIQDSTFEGKVDLQLVRAAGKIEIIKSRIKDIFDAHGFRSDMVLDLSDNHFSKSLAVDFAKIEGYLDLTDSVLDGGFNGAGLQLGASLFIRSLDQKASFGNVNLRSSRLANNVDLSDANFNGTIDLDSARIGSSLFIRKSMADQLILKNAIVTRNIDLNEAWLIGSANGSAIQADAVEVGATLQMVHVVVAGNASFRRARVTGNATLDGSHFAALDLSGSTIGGELSLIPWENWRFHAGDLCLRNANVGYYFDSKDSWPTRHHLYLDGFSFAHLGGRGDKALISRKLAEWQQWLNRDEVYRPGVYDQLVAAYMAAGRPNDADDIRFMSRQHHRQDLWVRSSNGRWDTIVNKMASFGEYVLELIAGYGIGVYTFRVLAWVLLFTVSGAAYLYRCVPVAHWKGPAWCLGATLSRLLPIIDINREFADFFNDPRRERLTGWQSFVFSAIGMIGWVLGGIMIAAFAGLTHRG